jgi:hypothetical protein
MTNGTEHYFSNPKNAAKAGHLGGKARWAKVRREKRLAELLAKEANGNGHASHNTYVKDPEYVSYGLPVDTVPSPAKTSRQKLYDFVRQNKGKWVPVYCKDERFAKSLQMIAAGNGFKTAVRGKALYLKVK